MQRDTLDLPDSHASPADSLTEQPLPSSQPNQRNTQSNRLKILFLPPLPHREDPWRQDIIQAIDPRHELAVWNRQLPVAQQFSGMDVVVDASGAVPSREMANAATSVKLWQLQSVGYDSFDLDYWRQKNITVANCPGQLSATAVAECALLFMLALARRWSEAQFNLHHQVFHVPMGQELENRSLALIGFGASARELALRAKALHMRLSALDVRRISAEEAAQFGLEFSGGPEHLEALLAGSDFVSLHLPLSPETRHTLNAKRLRLMKPTAILINVARGGLVDQEALYAALLEGRLAGAGLDVFESEPADPHHPLLQLPNVMAMPHIAGNTHEISRRRGLFARENIERVALPVRRLVI